MNQLTLSLQSIFSWRQIFSICNLRPPQHLVPNDDTTSISNFRGRSLPYTTLD